MSASLDKSLDDIISSSRKTFKSRRPGAKVGAKGGNQNRVGKKLGGSNNKKILLNPTRNLLLLLLQLLLLICLMLLKLMFLVYLEI